jgi:hypothetical protein
VSDDSTYIRNPRPAHLIELTAGQHGRVQQMNQYETLVKRTKRPVVIVGFPQGPDVIWRRVDLNDLAVLLAK